ncbi:type I-E CRISPR-associated protein Cas6/Cse3/CasE [uncultured Sphingomonas sp.]|uniref:type I-E CRISPR-associated protein Cas6/Cse3/CasE n=1 Tax=uncultured Sphingomonas sp. TaxID=158754 RepID=UPI0035C9E845
MTLHLVRLAVDLRGLASFAVAKGIGDDDGGYALHLALRDRFGAAGPQPFRFFPEHRRGPHLLGYAMEGDALKDAAGLPVIDDLLRGVFPGAAEIQPMPDAWREGSRYGFKVRVRPVVRYGGRVRAERRIRPGAWQNRAGEVDAFVAACEKAGHLEEGGAPVDREAVYKGWLEKRLAGAAGIEAAELRQLRRVNTKRSLHAKPSPADRERAGGGHHVRGRRLGVRGAEGPEALMAGTLAVADPDAFARLLARGVGRHAAFGFGMLLLSPPGRAS